MTISKDGTSARQKLLKTFSVDVKSEADDTRYIGTFTTRKLSIMDISSLGVRKAQLNAGMHYTPTNPGHGVDETTDEFNNMIAHLELSLEQCPVWWDLNKITDVSVIGTVYQEVLAHENTFLVRPKEPESEALGQGSTGVSQGRSAGTTQESDDSGNAHLVVGEEVQAALEP